MIWCLLLASSGTRQIFRYSWRQSTNAHKSFRIEKVASLLNVRHGSLLVVCKRGRKRLGSQHSLQRYDLILNHTDCQELDRKLATCVSRCLHGLRVTSSQNTVFSKYRHNEELAVLPLHLSPPLWGADSSFFLHSIWLSVDSEPGAEDWNSRTRRPSPCLLCDAVCVRCLATAMRVTENAPVTTGLLPRYYICNFIMSLPLVFTPPKVLYPRPLHSEAKTILLASIL